MKDKEMNTHAQDNTIFMWKTQEGKTTVRVKSQDMKLKAYKYYKLF